MERAGKEYEYQSGMDALLKRIKELEQEVERLRTAISEAEYAMVGGNDIREDIPWETANSWFRYIEQALKGEEYGSRNGSE
jgi:hypothetical protein